MGGELIGGGQELYHVRGGDPNRDREGRGRVGFEANKY